MAPDQDNKPDHNEDQGLDKVHNAVGYGVAAALLFAVLYWVLSPLPLGEAAARQDVPRAPSDEDYLLDCFILRDASKSLEGGQLDEIEKRIIDSLVLRPAGDRDRLSYTLFGDTKPDEQVQPPSSDPQYLASVRSIANKRLYDTTDFASIFDRLQDAISKTRGVQLLARPRAHADVVLILTDGIPDLTPGGEDCPDAKRTFISKDIIESFEALVANDYKTHEPLYVNLVLADVPPDCHLRIGTIVEEWLSKLGPIAGPNQFNVISSVQPEHIKKQVMEPLRRPRLMLLLGSVGDGQREKLDTTGGFAIKYSAQSRHQGGSVKLESASLVSDLGGEEIPLFVFKNEDGVPTDKNEVVELAVPEPAAGEMVGPVLTPDKLYFRLVDEHGRERLSDSSSYYLSLTYESKSSSDVEIFPKRLYLAPCRRGLAREITRARLEVLEVFLEGMALLFGFGLVSWWAARYWQHGITVWWRQRVEKYLVRPWQVWIAVALIVAVPMVMGFVMVVKIATLAFVVPLLGLLFFLAEKVKGSSAKVLVTLTIEFVALKLVAHLLILGGH